MVYLTKVAMLVRDYSKKEHVKIFEEIKVCANTRTQAIACVARLLTRQYEIERECWIIEMIINSCSLIRY